MGESTGRGAALVTTISGFVYPFAVLFAVRHEESAALYVLAALAVVWAAAAALRAPAGWARLRPVGAAVLLLLAVVVARRLHFARLALAWPVAINLFFLWRFVVSLRTTPMVERFARMQDPDLSPPKVAHCRSVTKLWCWFFVVNAAISAALAIAGDVRWWAAYTGVIAYVLMALLFMGEVVVRKARFGFAGDRFTDRVAARVVTLWRAAFAR